MKITLTKDELMKALQRALEELHPTLVEDSNVTDLQSDFSGPSGLKFTIELTKETAQ